MKKAKIWAILMAGILVTTTFANDYIVASAEEVETSEEESGDEEILTSENSDLNLDFVEEEGTEESQNESEGEGEDEESDESEGDGSEEGVPEVGDESGEPGSQDEDQPEETPAEETPEEETPAEETPEEETAYPAVTLSGSAGGMYVSVDAPDGALPEGTTLNIVEIPGDQYTAAIESLIGEDKQVSEIKALDITFTHNGSTIQPKSDVSVSVSGLDLSGDSVIVYHDGGSLSQVGSGSTDDVTFTSSSFSPFIFPAIEDAPLSAPVTGAAPSEEPDEDTDSDSALTDDDSDKKSNSAKKITLKVGETVEVTAEEFGSDVVSFNSVDESTYVTSEISSDGQTIEFTGVKETLKDESGEDKQENLKIHFTNTKGKSKQHNIHITVAPAEVVQTVQTVDYTVYWVDRSDNNRTLKKETRTGKIGDTVSYDEADEEYDDYHEFIESDPEDGSIVLGESGNVIKLYFKTIYGSIETSHKVFFQIHDFTGIYEAYGKVKDKTWYSLGKYEGTPDSLRKMYDDFLGAAEANPNNIKIDPKSAWRCDIDNATAASLIVSTPADFDNKVDEIRSNGFDIEWYQYEVSDVSTDAKLRSSNIVIHCKVVPRTDGAGLMDYTVNWLNVADNTPVKASETRHAYAGETVSAKSSDMRVEGYVYDSAASADSLSVTLGEDSDNEINLYFISNKAASYTVQRYIKYGESKTAIGEPIKVEVSIPGDQESVFIPEKDINKYKTYSDGDKSYTYTGNNKTDGGWVITDDSTVVELYYKTATSYTVKFLFEYTVSPEDGDVPAVYDYKEMADYPSQVISNQNTGSKVSYKADQNIVIDGVLYTKKEVKGIDALSPNPDENIVYVYYDMFYKVKGRDGKVEVYFSLLYPGLPYPTTPTSQDNKFYYPTNDGVSIQKGRWKGTADSLPVGKYAIFDLNGIEDELEKYNVRMDDYAQEQFDAYLASFPGENVKVTWYTYKNDTTRYGSSANPNDWYVNGYITYTDGSSMQVVKYDQNFAGGSSYVDENLPADRKYTILSYTDSNIQPLTVRQGYTFKGWSEQSDATEPDPECAPGKKKMLSRSYVFYAVWQNDKTDVTVKASSAEKVYDGTPLTAGVESDDLDASYTITATTAGSKTNVADDGQNTISGDVQITKDGEDVTDQFNITISDVPGTLTITPAPLTVKTGSKSWVYDTKEHQYKDGAGVSGLVNGETLPMEVIGKIKDIGTTPNTYALDWEKGTAVSGNYTVTEDLGTLEITAPDKVDVVLEAASDSKEYDGTELKLDSVSASGLPAGFTYEAHAKGVQKEVGSSANEIEDGYKILNPDGVDVTNDTNIVGSVVTKSGTLKVTPRTVTVTTGSDSKVYDGDPLVCDEASIDGLATGDTVTVKATGTITEVGTTPNTYSIDWGTVNKKNYTVSEKLGKLTVTENNEEILVTVTGGTYTYDGQAHGPVITITGAGLSYTNDASNASPVENVAAGKAAYYVDVASSKTSLVNVGSVAADIDNLVIRNAGGTDVTSRLTIKKDLTNSTVKVIPASVTIATDSATRTYNGKALTAGGRISGLIDKEKDGVVFTVTGSQTKVGSSANTYTIEWGNVSSDNYTVTESIGTLTVKAAPTPDNPTPDDPTPDDPTPDNPTPDNPTPDNPTPDNPTPVVPIVPPTEPNTPGDNVITDITTTAVVTTTIPDDAVPLAGVLGAERGIEADASSVLGARVAAANAGVLGARRDAQTADSNHMAAYLILMGIATGVGGAYVTSRRKKDFLTEQGN